MTATGNITEDLLAIRQIIVDVGHPDMHFGREPWWGEPASEESIEALIDGFGELPQDVIDFYRVTETATFAVFDDIQTPLSIMRGLGLEKPFDEEGQRDYPFMFEENLPQGHGLLDMTLSNQGGLIIELGGPDHGRAISPLIDQANYFRTLAWSFTDAIACVRELHEFGWYRRWEMPEKWARSEELLATVQPILDKWNCNPLLAGFVNSFGYEPERPKNRY